MSNLLSFRIKEMPTYHCVSQTKKGPGQSTEEVIADNPPLQRVRIMCPPAPIKEKVDSETQNSRKPALSSGQTRQIRNSWSEYSKKILEDQ